LEYIFIFPKQKIYEHIHMSHYLNKMLRKDLHASRSHVRVTYNQIESSSYKNPYFPLYPSVKPQFNNYPLKNSYKKNPNN
jgi:hypothetical protein